MGVIFGVFFDFWGSVFKPRFFVVFWDRFFMDVGLKFISTPFFDICLYLSAPLVLVIFGNLSIRKRVSYKSKGIKFSIFSTCFVDFVSSVVFHQIV